MAYDLSLTEEQQALITTARDFTKKEITPVAAHYDEHDEFPAQVLKDLYDPAQFGLGVLGFERAHDLVALFGRALALAYRQADHHVACGAEVLHLHILQAQRGDRIAN